MVSWSNADQKQIEYEMEAKGIIIDRLDEVLDNWIDSQKIFDEILGAEKNTSLSNALIIADIDAKGSAHDGLVDAYNTALLFAKMKREPELQLNPIYEKAHSDEVEHLNYTMLNLLGSLNIAVA